ncbi:hypothetical protein M422DRAFT_67067 [Sphaerobolus stellatus SS14]|uniref:Uncharacterized protein n=1 Tax=Sphaerobolus stellatus (strain SS14) TaxID=990650 RepID=A0A0C9VSU9_SPHS4|nr:hypothetical protein M422DRAFT_67067 [Sphaerobolus stellatus SS14]
MMIYTRSSSVTSSGDIENVISPGSSLDVVCDLNSFLDEQVSPAHDDIVKSIEIIQSSQEDISSHTVIHFACLNLVAFLDGLLERKEADRHLETGGNGMQTLSLLLTSSFMTELFERRRAANSMVIEGSQYSIPANCLDVLLAKICDTIVFLSGQEPSEVVEFEQSSLTQELALSNYMNSQTHKGQTIQAISQLPLRWYETVGVIGADSVSEAARRAVFILLFGVYVFRPRITDSLSQTILPSYVQTALQKYVSRLLPRDMDSLISYRGSHVEVIREDIMSRFQYSLLLNLLSLDIVQEQSSIFGSSFGPATLDVLKDLISTVVSSSELGSVLNGELYDCLSDAQYRLLRWGLVAPWIWLLWGNDKLSANLVQGITATWLHDLAHQKDVEEAVEFAPATALDVFLSLLPPGSSITHALLFKLSWATSYVCRSYLNKMAEPQLSRTCQELLLLLPELSWDEVDSATRREITELILKICLKRDFKCSISDGKLSSIMHKAAESIARLILHPWTFIQSPDPTSDQPVKAILNMFILFYAVNLLPNYTNSIIPPLLQHLITLLTSPTQWTSGARHAAVTLLACLCTLHPQTIFIVSVYESMLAQASSDDQIFAGLFLTRKSYLNRIDRESAAIASNICNQGLKKIQDPLLLFRLWDYLRDALLLILQVTNDSLIPQVLLSKIFSTICVALVTILSNIPASYGISSR